MAKKEDNEASTETSPAPATEDSRFVILTVPEGDPVTTLGSDPTNGEPLALTAGQIKRTDYIRALARTGDWTRGEIAKHLTELQGKKVAYQIVFQATKNIPNVKLAQRAGGEAEAPAETAPAE